MPTEEAADAVRASIASHIVDDPGGLVAYQIDHTATGDSLASPLYTLVDRSGSLLARARNLDSVITSLHHYLGALWSTNNDGDAVALRTRAICRSDGTVFLVMPSCLAFERLPERRLHTNGLAMVDAPWVLVSPDGKRVIPGDQPDWFSNWLSTARGPNPPIGHVSSWDIAEPRRIKAMLWPQSGDTAKPSPAQLVATIAGLAVPGVPRSSILDQAVALGQRLDCVSIEPRQAPTQLLRESLSL